MPEVRALPALVQARTSSASGSSGLSASHSSTARQWRVSYRSQSSSDESISVTTRGARLDDRDGAVERGERLVPLLVVVGQRPGAPVRLADDDVAARPHARLERVERAGEAAVDEARAEAERGVVGAGASSSCEASAEPERDEVGDPALAARSTAAAWNSGAISIPSTVHPNSRARRIAGPPRPDATSRTRDPGPSRMRRPRRSSFSSDVGFWISWSRSATTK